MKTILKEKVTTSVYNVYVANDGKEFDTAEECKKYESSAYAAVNTKYQQLVVSRTTEWNLYDEVGCQDTDIELVRISSKDDIDIVMQMHFVINPHCKDESHEAVNKRMLNLAERALKENDLLVVGRGFENEESFWFYGTISSIKESFSNNIDRIVNDANNEEK